MSISDINNFQTPAVQTPEQKKAQEKQEKGLQMDDFFTLMVAQLQNQDMYNSTDNSEFMAQMAQYSMVEALTDLKKLTVSNFEIAQTNYTMGLIGKHVVLAVPDENGELTVIKGQVEGVNLYNGDAQVIVDGKSYSTGTIMEVLEKAPVVDPPVEEGEDGEITDPPKEDEVKDPEEKKGVEA